MKQLLFVSFSVLVFWSCQHEAISPGLLFESSLINTPHLNIVRSNHRSLALKDGRVLVTGGRSYKQSHYLFSPDSKDWTTLEESKFKYQTHDMVMLADGRVLISGGFQEENKPGKGSEVFDPHTQSWREISKMKRARAGHTLTLLNDGRIMAAGGFSSLEVNSATVNEVSSTIEFFDPITETWSLGPNMLLPRALHHSLKLEDGRVLIIGGNRNELLYEIFDPTTSQSVPITSPPIEVRAYFAVAVLDTDHILLSGGEHQNEHFGNTACAIYTISTDSWRLTSPMQDARKNHTLLPISGGVIAISGDGPLDGHPFYPSPIRLTSCERYDVATDSWRIIGHLKASRAHHISTWIGENQILTVGGSNVEFNAEIQTINE